MIATHPDQMHTLQVFAMPPDIHLMSRVLNITNKNLACEVIACVTPCCYQWCSHAGARLGTCPSN